jgi:hypothetical protein
MVSGIIFYITLKCKVFFISLPTEPFLDVLLPPFNQITISFLGKVMT